MPNLSQVTEFDLTLFDDDVTRDKLKVMNRLEAMFDDARNKLPDNYFSMVDQLPLGATVRFTMEVIAHARGGYAAPSRISHCTLTGVDDRTPLYALADISREYGFAEWGFLYSPSRAGLPGRYPSIAKIQRALQGLPAEVGVALHVCGDGVLNLLVEEPGVSALVQQVGQRGGRVQLNFSLNRGSVAIERLRGLFSRFPDTTFITQYNAANLGVADALTGFANHAVLMDASGGNGLTPSEWPALIAGVSCGYAGGLGPDTLQLELGKIAKVAGDTPVWVDMESKIRTPDNSGIDWLDLDKAWQCLAIVSEFG